MRRSIVLAAAIAASTAIFGACEPKANAPETTKPQVTSTPASTPVASPSGSPAATPANGNNGIKPGSSPEVKKPETKPTDGNVKKDEKPANTEKKDK